MAGYAVLDVETTGLSPERGDRVVEVAVVHVAESGDIENSWSTLINPGRDVGPTHIHRIDNATVANAPTFVDVLPFLSNILSGRVFTAHNAAFDLRFMLNEYGLAGHQIDANHTPKLCTMRRARQFLQVPKVSLAVCCEAAGVPLDDTAHAAATDALATAQLLAQYLRRSEGHPAWQPDLDLARSYLWPGVSEDATPSTLRPRNESPKSPLPPSRLF